MKQEGDGCSPAGVFALPLAFGAAAPEEASWVRMPYLQTTSTLHGIDDPGSRFYNQILDSALVEPDWTSSETMNRDDGLYRWGVFVGHNSGREAGGGSCIYLHLWRAKGQGTAGCTAMAEKDMKDLLGWLNPDFQPCLVQVVAPDGKT